MKQLLFLVCAVWLFVVPAMAQETEGEDSLYEQPDLLAEEQPDLLSDEFDDFSLDDDYLAEEDLIYDPLEPLNRVFFQFNDKLYFWVLKPVKTGYSWIIPEELRKCIGNFFNNLAAPIRLINNLLQGRFKDAGVVVARFFINSTIGVYGFADVALEEFNLEPRLADFGQTLGFYGIGEGIYICWPFLGPSNIRDSFGLAGDTLTNPAFHVDMSTNESVMYYGTNRVNFLSLTPDVYEDMKKYSLDPYIATRQSYMDFRRNVVKKAKKEKIEF